MKKVVIDINVLMDFLFKREGHEKAAEVLTLCARGKMTGFVCAHEITTLYYFLDKSIKDKVKVRKSILGIMKQFKIIEVNEEFLNSALSSEIDDYEDAVIEVSSKARNVDYILTRNIRDFRKSLVKAITPEEMLAMVRKELSESIPRRDK